MFPSLPVLLRFAPVCLLLAGALLPLPALAQGGLCVVVDACCGGGVTPPPPPPVCTSTELRFRDCVDSGGTAFTATQTRSQTLSGGTCVWGAWSPWSPPGGTCDPVTSCSGVQTETRDCVRTGEIDENLGWGLAIFQRRTKTQFE